MNRGRAAGEMRPGREDKAVSQPDPGSNQPADLSKREAANFQSTTLKIASI